MQMNAKMLLRRVVVIVQIGALHACVPWVSEHGMHMTIPAAAEWLPVEFEEWRGNECYKQKSAAVASAAYAARFATAKYGGPIAPTVGKALHFPIAWYLRIAAAGREAPSFNPPDLGRADEKFARVSRCGRHARAHECMFGTYSPPAPGSFSAEDLETWRGVTNETTMRSSFASVFYAGVVASIMAPDPFISPSISVAGAQLGDEPYGVVHARRGDACERWANRTSYGRHFYANRTDDGDPLGRACYPWSEYEEQIRRIASVYGVKRFLILSEDPVPDGTLSWIEPDRTRSQGGADGALFSLALARRGCVFVGHFWSHFSIAMYYAMAGWNGFAPPFISMDGGGILHMTGKHNAFESMLHFALLQP